MRSAGYGATVSSGSMRCFRTMGMISMADEFTMSHIFRASRQKVWDAWTRPEILAQWFGPKARR
jgi:hypothetical protein